MSLLDLGLKLLEASGREAFLVQIGASDGVTSDPFYRHRERSWIKGLLVEPLEAPFRQLRRNYEPYRDRFTCRNVAIADYNGVLRLFVPEAESGSRTSQKTSFRSQQLTKHGLSRYYTLDVSCCTIAKRLGDAGVSTVDILIIDTEGLDWRILQSAFSADIEPSLIYFEVIHLTRSERQSCRAALRHRGYAYCESLKDCLALKLELLC